MNEDEYLNERLANQISWYSKKGSINKALSNITKALVIILASLITVLTQIEFDSGIKNTILAAIAALIAIISGVSGAMKFQEKWTKYRTTAETLKHEQWLYKTGTGPYDNNSEAFKTLVPRVENLISRENSMWSEYVSKSG